MLKEEFKKLIGFFEKGAQGKSVNMNEVLEQSMHFFGQLQQELQTASPEDRAIIMDMMNQMYEKIQAESARISEKTGMSEDQLLNYAENPRNFTPDQWFKIQETKKKMMRTGRTISKILHPKDQKAEDESVKTKKAPSKKAPLRVKKKNWLKS